MPNFIKIFFTACMALGISSCNEELTYNYLVQHPIVLKQKIDECQAASNQGKPQTTQCALVFYAAANFISVLDEAGNDPEKLGQRVLDVEMQYAQAKHDYEIAERVLEELRNKHAPDKDIQSAKDNLTQAHKAFDDKEEEMRFLLAVIGLNSPE